MVNEISMMKVNEVLMSLDSIFPDLKDWDYAFKYKRNDPVDEEQRRKNIWTRKSEIEKVTRFMTAYLDMGFEPNGSLFKKCIMYYIVLLNSEKYNLNISVADDDIFEEV